MGDTPIIQAYRIQDSNMVFQTDYQSHHPLAVGLAIDTDSEFLFITHEYAYGQEPGNQIEIVNAKTMQYVDTVIVTGVTNLAGIVVDEGKQKVYTMQRLTNHLFVYSWNPIEKELTPDLPYPYYVELQDCSHAHGLALDEGNNRLYVADDTTAVKYYDTNDWSHDPNDYIIVSHQAVGVAVDPNRYVYTGSGRFGGMLLSQYDLSADPNTAENTVDVNSPVLGIAVDQQTGLIYLTTYGTGYDEVYPDPCTNDRLLVYDSNLTRLWVSDDIGNPAGVAVAGNVSYKFPLLLSKIDDVNDGNCVSPGDYITYTITYGNSITDPNDPNYAGTVNNVNIVDYLPVGVTYESVDWDDMSVDPSYNANNHTYTWYIETLAPGDVNSVTLKVEVNKLAEPLGTIHNYCEIDCDLANNTAEVNTPVCCWSPDIIYVDVNAVGSNTGLSWYHADPNLQHALQKAKAWDSNQIWVASGTYKPTTEPGDYYTAFELVNGVDIYGGFAGTETNPSQRNWMINETILDGNLPDYGVVNVVGANDVNEATIIDGFTITNGWWGGIYSVNSSLIIGHNRIIDNGYGIICINWSSVNVTNCDIIKNRGRTKVSGGGIYCEDSNSLIVTNCIISENASDANGGGICCKDSNNLTVMDCTITDNEAGNYGGAIYHYNSLFSAITNSTFSGNSADEGGGLLLYDSSSPNIANCIFTGNKATYYGGAMSSYYSSPTVVNCIFSGNKADYGGGICNALQSSPAIINCTFSGNLAGTYGGGMYNYGALLEPDIANCIFWDNDAVTGGNEIYNHDTVPNVSYCDIAGGGYEEGTGNIDSAPCFVTVNSPTGSWTENASYDSSTFQSTLTDSGADWAVNELAGKFVNPDTPNQYLQFFIVSNDVNTIKVWSDVTAIAESGDTYQIYDYHLISYSACIDRGDPNGDYTGWTDIDGERRVVDGDDNGTKIVDMGADEYSRSPADFNSDGIVNFFDYALFANFWQKTSDVYDLIDDNNYIDYNDLDRFCEDWLWQRAWAKAFPYSYGQGMGKSMGLGMSEGLGLAEELYPSAPAKKPQAQLTKADIEEIIKWLTELWLTEDELRKMISEDEWLKFIESVIQR